MEPIRVLIINSNFILGAGIESLLVDNEAMAITGMVASDPETMLKQIIEIDPQVIICDEIIFSTHLTALVKASEPRSTLRLVVLGLKDNCLKVFDKQEIYIQQKSDFFSIISVPT